MDPLWQQLPFGNGYLLLFLIVLADQAGLPIPAAPALVAAGVMARSGAVEMPRVMGLCVVASVLGHGAWYVAGRRRGAAIINLLCKLSLEPDAWARRTEELFKHVGPLSLLWFRFVPGLDVLAQPLVAMAGLPWPNYVLITVVGAAMWSGVLMALGYQLGQSGVDLLTHGAGARLMGFAAAAVVAYILYKLVLRLLGRNRGVPRLAPADLMAMFEAGRPLVIVDLRTAGELARSCEQIPGSRHLGRREIRALARQPRPGWGAVVLCDSAAESDSAYMAAVLRRGGWTEAWALAGGFSQWKKAGYPTRPWAQP